MFAYDIRVDPAGAGDVEFLVVQAASLDEALEQASAMRPDSWAVTVLGSVDLEPQKYLAGFSVLA